MSHYARRCPDCQDYIPSWKVRCSSCGCCEDCCRCPVDPDELVEPGDPDSMEDDNQPYFWNR